MAPRNTRVNPEVEVRSPARSFAKVLDNYYAPSRDRRGEQAFQQGVNAFGGLLEEKANRLKSQRRKDETQQGVADAMREQAGEEMKGVKTGSIFRQNSSFYMAGLNETRGKAAGNRFKPEIYRAYEEWPGKYTDDDGTGVRQWMNDRVAGFIDSLGDDPNKIAGALPIINEVTQNLAARHTAFTNKRLHNESMDAYDEIVSGVFDDLSTGDLDMEMAVDAIANEADMMYTTDGAQANDRVVGAAIRHANINNDPTALFVMGKAHDTGKLKLSQTNNDRLANAREAVEAKIQRKANRESAEEAEARKVREREVTQSWYEQLQKNPYTDITEWAAQNGVEGIHFKNLNSLQSSMMRGAEVTDPAITTQQRIEFEEDLYNAKTRTEKIDELKNFTAANPTALTRNEISRYVDHSFESTDEGSIINDPIIRRFRKSFGDTLGTFSEGNKYLSTDQAPFIKTQGIEAYNSFLVNNSKKVDMSDPSALMELHDQAEAAAIEELTKVFTDQMGRKAKSQPEAGEVLGVPDELEERQKEDAAAAAEEFRKMADDDEADAAEEFRKMADDDKAETEGVQGEETRIEPTAAEPVEIDQQALEEEPAPFDDPDTDQEYSPVREGFYGEMIHRFTDGEDTRTTLESANRVLQDNPDLKEGISRLATKYNIPAISLLAIMDFETGGSFDPAETNQAGSGATGLIQFMPETARSLGTTTAELAQMSQTEQLVYVEKYFDQFGDRLSGGNLDDIYMAVLWPKAIGKPDGYVLFRRGTEAYGQNSGLDHNEDGTITKYEAATEVRRRFYGY
jgi:hypothetical protein